MFRSIDNNASLWFIEIRRLTTNVFPSASSLTQRNSFEVNLLAQGEPNPHWRTPDQILGNPIHRYFNSPPTFHLLLSLSHSLSYHWWWLTNAMNDSSLSGRKTLDDSSSLISIYIIWRWFGTATMSSTTTTSAETMNTTEDDTQQFQQIIRDRTCK